MNPQYMPQQFGAPHSQFQNMPGQLPNGPAPGSMPPQNRPPPQHMGQPPQNMGPPPQNMGPPPQNMRPSPQNMPPGPTGMGPPQNMGPPIQKPGQVPLPQQNVRPPQNMGPPLSNMGPPQQSMGPPPQNMGAPQQNMGHPPAQSMGPPPNVGTLPSMGPPTSMGAPPPHFQNGPLVAPPQMQNGPPSGPNSAALPPGQLPPTKNATPDGPFPPQNQLPRPMSRPQVQGQGPNQFSQPPLPGMPPMPGQNSSPRPGNDRLPGQPPMSGQGPNQFSQPPHPGMPPMPGQNSTNDRLPGQPPQGPNQFSQPPGPGMPGQNSANERLPGQFSQPPLGMPPLPGQNLQSRPVNDSLAGQPPPSGPHFPGQGPPNQFNQPLPTHPPNQFGPGPQGGFNQQPPMSMPGQPPMPNQQQPMPGQPPLPGQQYNQLNNQMQGMNLGGPRQYPGGPMKNAMNGDNGPHMPPPMNQNQKGYMNGQQIRSPQMPGYPPMPGQAPAPGGPGSYPQMNYQQQQQQQQNRRLDPDQMPSPIQVMQDDQELKSGVFVTNQKGLVPPLVTTNFTVQDQGNASPRYIRSTMYNVPISQDIMKQTAVPFSLVISPMARTVDPEYPPPIVNFGELGPVRCVRCKAYMCPYMQFVDSGRRFQCLFCKATTDVPAEYFQHLDHTGQRMDRFERPELILGTYEFVATSDYCRNNTLPKPPAIIFVIDVSYNNVKSGLVHLLCSQMKDIIQNLPVDQGQEKSNMRVGFITYNSSVHFYNVKGTLAAPQMMIVGDTQEMFMPLLDGFLVTPEESAPIIDALMQQIPAMFGDTRETETVLLPAVLAGLEALKASECAGKLLVFHSSLPTAEAPGKLKNRDDRKLLATDKEKTVLTPQNQAYNQLGQDCVGAGCSVDLFIFNNAYIDIATIGQVSRLTGGEVFKYTYFQADLDGERLIKDIITDISRPIAFDSIMRVRTSTGVRPTDFYGHMFMSNTTDMELAAVDCDKAVAVEIKHDDKLTEEEGVYIQAALLYTSCSGQRRLRIINLSLKTCSQMADLYRSCDLDTLINYIAKQSAYKLLENSPKAVKDVIINRAAQILATYRKNCASPSSAGQLILPECMKLLPLYVNCLLKSDALSGGSDMTIDDRSFVMQAVMTMDIQTSVHYFYPRLIPLHEIDPTKNVEIPAPVRCTVEKMNEQGVYVLENGIHMFLWIGLGASPDFIQKVFGAPSAIQVDIERVDLPELDNPLSLAVRTIIEEIRIQRHRCMRLTIVRQREKLEPVYKHFLAEDRGTDGSASYVDFLCHMHKEIRTLLS